MGGMTVDYKMGIANSYYYSYNLDGRTFPSQLSILPQSRAIATNLQDLITNVQQDLNGIRWGIGSSGFLYRIDENNNVSSVLQIPENGSTGLFYASISDQLYIPGQTAVSLYGQVTTGAANNPVYRQNLWDVSASVAMGCVSLYDTATGYWDGGLGYRNNIINNATGAGTLGLTEGLTLGNYSSLVTNTLTNTYVLPSTIIEDATDLCPFAPDIEPGYAIAVYVTTVGTGNWTLTLHNSLNIELASVTIDNADIQTGWNLFTFGEQVRMFINASNIGYAPTYHFHLTSSVTGDTAAIATTNQQDISGANMVYFAYTLVQTNNGWHPTAYFTGTGSALLCIGNGEYLTTYNFGNDANPSNSMYVRHQLVFRPGEEVCGLSTNYGYLVIATGIVSNDSNRNAQIGRLYFWSGSTTNPDFYIDLPQGIPYGLYSYSNVTWMEIEGSLYVWSGGQTVIKVRKLAYQNTDYMDAVDKTIAYPYSISSRYNILMMGYPSYTTDPNINYGIWSYGAVELTYPDSYVLSYTQSCDILEFTTQNQRYLGCCVNFVDSMYSSWQYTDDNGNTHYGLDVVDNFSDPADTFVWMSLIFDGGAVYKEKQALRYKIYFEALPDTVTITPFYIIDRGETINGPTVSDGATEVFFEINNGRFHELQWGLMGTSSGTEPATILGISMEINPLKDEVNLIPGEV